MKCNRLKLNGMEFIAIEWNAMDGWDEMRWNRIEYDRIE